MTHLLKLLPLLALTACSVSDTLDTHTPTDFLTALSPLCNQTYTGKVVSDDPQDEDWRKEVLTLGPIRCSEGDVIAMPLAVGANKSRTWFLKPTEKAIEFRHQHVLDNGDIDPVSDYGGYSTGVSKSTSFTTTNINGETQKDSIESWSVDFPADEKTKAIFTENGLEASTTNIWSFDYREGAQLVYELNREGRHFRAEFDLSQPL